MLHNSAPAPHRRLIVATANEGKLREFRALLEGLPFEPVSLAVLNIPSPAETGTTFLENALLKARHAAASFAAREGSSAAALADDSGLEVAGLGGAPGIFSARYAGVDADDAANNAKLAAALGGLTWEQRRARYRCALAFVTAADDPHPLTAIGDWRGVMLAEPKGTGGFGYDPYFWLPELGKTAAELAGDVKNRLSHRGIAMRTLREALLQRFTV